MKRSLFLIAAVLTATGCSTIDVKSRVAPDADLSRYHTYAWFTPPTPRPESIADQEIRAALERNLAAKGYTPAPAGVPPDFLVAYHVKQQQQTEADWGYGPMWWGPGEVYTYTQGTIVVDFIDHATNRVFWRGTATSIVDHPNNPDPKKIEQAVAKMVQKFPAQVASAAPPPM